MALMRQVAGFNSDPSRKNTGMVSTARLGKVDSATVDAWLEPYTGDPVAYGGTSPDGIPAIIYPIRPVGEVPEDGSVLNSGAPGGPYTDVPQDTTPNAYNEPPILTETANQSPVPNGPVNDDAAASGGGDNSWLWLLALGFGGYMLYKNGGVSIGAKKKRSKWLMPAAVVTGVGLLYLYSKKNPGAGNGTGTDTGDGGNDGGSGGETPPPAGLYPAQTMRESIIANAPFFAASNISFVRRALLGYASNDVIDSMGSAEIMALYKYITTYIIQQQKPLTQAADANLYAQIVQIKNIYGIPLF